MKAARFSPDTPGRPTQDFLRGLVATGILSAIQQHDGRPRLDRRTLRLALQGGSALAAGSATARAWLRGQYAQALGSMTLGISAVLVIESLLQDKTSKEQANEQEKAQKTRRPAKRLG